MTLVFRPLSSFEVLSHPSIIATFVSEKTTAVGRDGSATRLYAAAVEFLEDV